MAPRGPVTWETCWQWVPTEGCQRGQDLGCLQSPCPTAPSLGGRWHQEPLPALWLGCAAAALGCVMAQAGSPGNRQEQHIPRERAGPTHRRLRTPGHQPLAYGGCWGQEAILRPP